VLCELAVEHHLSRRRAQEFLGTPGIACNMQFRIGKFGEQAREGLAQDVRPLVMGGRAREDEFRDPIPSIRLRWREERGVASEWVPRLSCPAPRRRQGKNSWRHPNSRRSDRQARPPVACGA